MRYGGGILRLLTACGLTAALLGWGVPVHAQNRIGGGTTGTGGMSSGGSGGFGGSGGAGGSGSSFGGSNSGSSLGGSNGQFSFAGGSSFVGSSGNSGTFAGSSGGGTFAGSSGGGTFAGSSGSGSYSGGGGGRGSSSLGGVSPMNPFASTFANPLAAGLNSNTAFGKAIYTNINPTATNLLTSTGSTLLGGSGGSGLGGMGTANMRSGSMGGMSGTGLSGNSGQASGYSILVLPPVPNAATLPIVPRTGPIPLTPGAVPNTVVRLSPLPARMQTDFQEIVTRSERIAPATRTGIKYGLDGEGNVVLRGAAANAAEAQTIETMLRFAPGVRAIRNEMTWK